MTPSDSQGMAGALDPTGAICGSYDEGVGTRICVDSWLLQLGEEKKKTGEGEEGREKTESYVVQEKRNLFLKTLGSSIRASKWKAKSENRKSKKRRVFKAQKFDTHSQ